MNTPREPRLQRVRASISEEAWNKRVAEARRRAGLLERVEELVGQGSSIEGAIRTVVPDEPVSTWRHRLDRYRAGGEEALINRRLVQRPEKVTASVVGMVRGLLLGNPELRSEQLCEQVEKSLGVRLGGSTMRQLLSREGLAQPQGRPSRRIEAEPHPLAGAELLKAVELEVGAVARLTTDVELALQLLPEPSGPVLDDSANRDEQGRFLPAYNEGQERGPAPVGPKFESVDVRREGRDLQAMRAANSSNASLYRKNLALTLLPCVTDGARLQSLRHWQGGQR